MMALAGRTAAGLLAAVILGAVLKRRTPELALLLGLAALAWVLSGLVQTLGELCAAGQELAQLAGVEDELWEPVVKTVLLSILTKLTAEFCRSAGEGGLASAMELSGGAAVLAVSLPLIRRVVQMLTELLT